MPRGAGGLLLLWVLEAWACAEHLTSQAPYLHELICQQPAFGACRLTLEPLIWSLSAHAFPASGPDSFSLSTDGNPLALACFVILLRFLPCLSVSVGTGHVCPWGRTCREEGIFHFLSNQLPETASGLDATGICREPL